MTSTPAPRRQYEADKVAEICALKGKETAAKIAERYGISRNAVIGLWGRNKHLLPAPVAEIEQPTTPVATPRTTVGAKPEVSPPPAKPQSRPERVGPALQPVVRPPAAPGPVLGVVEAVASIRNGQCRFPIGDAVDPGFRFCAEPTAAGPYCRAHAARCTAGTFRVPLAALNKVRA